LLLKGMPIVDVAKMSGHAVPGGV
jgi:hypothetical protein